VGLYQDGGNEREKANNEKRERSAPALMREAQDVQWLAAAWTGLHPLPWTVCALPRPCTSMPRCCSQTSYLETTPANEWHEPKRRCDSHREPDTGHQDRREAPTWACGQPRAKRGFPLTVARLQLALRTVPQNAAIMDQPHGAGAQGMTRGSAIDTSVFGHAQRPVLQRCNVSVRLIDVRRLGGLPK